MDDLINALKALGYKSGAATEMAERAIDMLGEDAPLGELVKQALRKPSPEGKPKPVNKARRFEPESPSKVEVDLEALSPPAPRAHLRPVPSPLPSRPRPTPPPAQRPRHEQQRRQQQPKQQRQQSNPWLGWLFIGWVVGWFCHSCWM